MLLTQLFRAMIKSSLEIKVLIKLRRRSISIKLKSHLVAILKAFVITCANASSVLWIHSITSDQFIGVVVSKRWKWF